MAGRPRALLKVILLGEPGVGKTSLIRRYVQGSFGEAYLATVGTTVSKRREVLPQEGEGEIEVTLVIWDIMGNKRILELLGEAYFYGARGALAVFDRSARASLDNLRIWIDAARNQEPRMPVVVLGNKADLEPADGVSDREAKRFCKPLGLSYLPTSAKTGLNVEAAFRAVGLEALRTFAAAEGREESE